MTNSTNPDEQISEFPWSVVPDISYVNASEAETQIIGNNRSYICAVFSNEDAAFIVSACNAHDAMVQAIESLLSMDIKGHTLAERLQFSDSGRALLEKANSALKLARGEPPCS